MGIHGRPPLDRPSPHRRRHPARSVLIVLDRLRAWPAFTVLIGWTLFLWASRTRNVVSNDALSAWGTTWRLGVVVVFVAGRGRCRRSARNRVLPVLVWWTIGYWLVRGGGIVLDANHDASFKVVHSVLMVISIGTAMWVWRTRVASLRDAMGQPVTLITTSSPRLGILRFELNRSLTGMGHVRYEMGDEIRADDPASELAKRLFDAGGVSAVHVYGSMVTVTLASSDFGDLETVIGGLYTYYLPGVEIPSDEELIAMVE